MPHEIDEVAQVLAARERFTKGLRSEKGAGETPALVSVLDDAGQARPITALEAVRICCVDR